MRNKVAWLLPMALLISFHGSSPAQEKRDARLWLTTADRSALLAEQKDALHFSSSPKRVSNHRGKRYAAVPIHGWFRFRLDRWQRPAFHAHGPGPENGAAERGFRTRPMEPAELFEGDNRTSDMNDHVYSYDDLLCRWRMRTFRKFSFAPDRAEVIPALKEILGIDPDN